MSHLLRHPTHSPTTLPKLLYSWLPTACIDPVPWEKRWASGMLRHQTAGVHKDIPVTVCRITCAFGVAHVEAVCA